jgi:hypothetical protein
LQCMKSATAHRINKVLHLSGPVWEEESFDHVLRSDESLKKKCEYIRENPVRRGLVQMQCPRLLYQSRCESSVDFRFQRG